MYLQELKNNAEGEKAENNQAERAPPAAVPEDTSAASEEKPANGLAVSDPTLVADDVVDKSQDDTPDVPTRVSEKKRLHWKGKTCKYSASVPLFSYLTQPPQISHH